MKKNKGQTRLSSLIEAKVNTAIGFVMSTLAWHYLVPILFPHLAPHSDWGTAFGVTVFFTVLSVVRNYVIRRFFNYRSLQ